MNSSEHLNELATALAKAQAVMTGALKDSANPFFKSKYADLESVWAACRKALTDNGLSVVQFGNVFIHAQLGEQPTQYVSTRLMHTSGQFIEGSFPIRAKDDSPQAMGSAITYARRYGLAAMVGVYQTDDDAEAAQGRIQDRSGKLSTDGVNPADARKWAKAFRDGMANRNDEAILRAHDDLNAEPEVYQAVQNELEPKEKEAVREAIIRARQERARVKASF